MPSLVISNTILTELENILLMKFSNNISTAIFTETPDSCRKLNEQLEVFLVILKSYSQIS